MKRRELLQRSALFGLASAMPITTRLAAATPEIESKDRAASAGALKPPAQGSIPVAFVISDGAVMIDFAGPWEVFQDASDGSGMDMKMNLFSLYTVAETKQPIKTSGGMTIVPDHTFSTAPSPKVIVIPAQKGESQATLDWIRKSAKTADVTMSVCTGAFLLARTGLLSGQSATTHHAAFKSFAKTFPDVQLKRGTRFVENGNLATAGGLSSGIDLALRVVERYFGRDVAKQTAFQMEYQGEGWMKPNAVYAQMRRSTEDHPLCPVCDMDVDAKTAPTSVYAGKTYHFCSSDHKAEFDAAPANYID